MDIYKELAAAVIGKLASTVTAEERARAKQAFWGAFSAVAQLDGNEELARAAGIPRDQT